MKDLFTNYWSYLPVYTACKLNLFDAIKKHNNTIEKIANYLQLHEESLKYFITVLQELNFIKIDENKIKLTNFGLQLTENHPKSLKYACIVWGEEHLTAWQNMDITLKTGKSAFEQIYKKPFFDYISENKQKAEVYHKAMNEYARDDYENICEIIDFSIHKNITDVGGGLGALISIISKKYPYINCYLFEKPEVIELTENKDFNKIEGDFFDKINTGSDALIMSRIVHDWCDKKALQILKNANKALDKNDYLYLIENLTDRIENKAALLSLNMLIMTKSYERTQSEYENLLEKSGFKIIEIYKINELQYCLKCKKS